MPFKIIIILFICINFLVAKENKNILFISGNNQELAWMKEISSGLNNGILKNSQFNISIFKEFIDLKETKNIKKEFTEKYKNIKIDAVIVVDYSISYDYIKENFKSIFKDAIFYAIYLFNQRQKQKMIL